MTDDTSGSPFDFAEHERSSIAEYLRQYAYYSDLADVLHRILHESITRREIKVHSVEARPKDPASFGKKAAQPSEIDPTKPKYPRPMEQITDCAAARVITFFPSTISQIDQVVADEFEIVERSDKGAQLLQEERFGYNSVHYLVRLTKERAKLPEYKRFGESVVEIQARTILQHAWAEIEHDIQYKSAAVIPPGIRRRFMGLAGVLEIADREFQAVQDDDARLTREARSRVEGGHLAGLEITPDALKAFLDKRLGADARISVYSYTWEAQLLLRLGFRTLGQVDKCIRDYDDDRISRALAGGRQGQTTRFGYLLLAGMGEPYINRHSWAGQSWWQEMGQRNLELLRKMEIPIRAYDPLADPSTATA